MRGLQAVAEGKLKASELRENKVHAHAVALEAIGRAGNALLRERSETWKKDLAGLTSVDWSRTTPAGGSRVDQWPGLEDRLQRSAHGERTEEAPRAGPRGGRSAARGLVRGARIGRTREPSMREEAELWFSSL